MAIFYETNNVTMTLGDFLALRDAMMFQEQVKEFAQDSRCSYSPNKRDAYDIGRYVLIKLNIPDETTDECAQEVQES